MITNPLYLEDPYLTTMEATITGIFPEPNGVYRLILDQTVFYPMGGGQPTDQGTLMFQDGSKIDVYQVLLKEGEINHYIKTTTPPTVGQTVSGTIDWDRRYKNMKVHSAGHIVDFAVFLLGYSPSPLHPFKGDHGKKPFVLYSGTLSNDILKELQEKVDELSAKELQFSWSFELLDDIEKEAIYLQPGLPKNKPLRALRLEGVGVVADGGTIVASTKEIGRVKVVSIETKNDETSIHYRVE